MKNPSARTVMSSVA